MKQCFQCSELIDDDARSCRHCGRVQPIRKSSGFSKESKEAAHQRRLDRAHLPPWLQAFKDLAHLLKTDRNAEILVQALFAAAGIGITWVFLGVVSRRIGFFGLEGRPFFWARLALSLLSLPLGASFGSFAITQFAEALGEAVGHERDTRVKLAEMQRKADSKR